MNKMDKSANHCAGEHSVVTYARKNTHSPLRFFTTLLLLMLTVLCAMAQETSGTCGATDGNVLWEYDSSTTTLTISKNTTNPVGTDFNMVDYSSPSDQPWDGIRSNITTIVIGDGVTSIGNYAFSYCISLSSIIIPTGVTSIGDSAFRICSSLSSIIIPPSVTSIGNYAFSHCNLSTAYLLPATSPFLSGNRQFYNNPHGLKLFSHDDYTHQLTGNSFQRSQIYSVTTTDGITASLPDEYNLYHISYNGIDYYAEGLEITLEAAQGYSNSEYIVTDADGNDKTSEVLNGNTLTMPYYDIKVTSDVTVEESITITANEASLNGISRYWITFYHGSLSYQLPAGAQAFYVKGDDNGLYLLGNGDEIPAGCAVIIMSDTASIELTKLNSSSVAVPTDSKLMGTAASTAVSSLNLNGKKVYVMNKSEVDDELGFYEFSETTIPANKAYYLDD